MSKLLIRTFSKISKMCPKLHDSFVWIDLEMTGLDVKVHTILEVACLITTADLKCVHEGINLIIHQPEDVLKSMNSWSLVQHAQSGLTAQSRESEISLAEADEKISSYIKEHTNPKGNRYLAGNSVYMDKIFLQKYMPSVDSLLHYRILDVSSLKLLCSHWYPDEFSKMKKKHLTHRSFDDIKNSIDELKEYKQILFKNEMN